VDGKYVKGCGMKRLAVAAAAVAILGLVVAGMGANASATDERSPDLRELIRSAPDTVKGDRDRDHRLVFVERDAVETEINHGPEELSVGDQVVLSSVLTQKGKRKGTLDGHVVFTYVDFEDQLRALVSFTASLPRGEIEVQGVAVFKEETAEFDFGVTGGTDRFDDVGGEAHFIEDGNRIKVVFDLDELD
jgi:hypothetical protein